MNDRIKLLNFDGSEGGYLYLSARNSLYLHGLSAMNIRAGGTIHFILTPGWGSCNSHLTFANKVIRGLQNLCLNTSSAGLTPNSAAQGATILNYDDLGGTAVWVPHGCKPDGLGALGRHSLDRYLAFQDDFHYKDIPSHLWWAIVSGGGGHDVGHGPEGWVRQTIAGATTDEAALAGPITTFHDKDFDVAIRCKYNTTSDARHFVGLYYDASHFTGIYLRGTYQAFLVNCDATGETTAGTGFFASDGVPFTIRLQYSHSGHFTRCTINGDYETTNTYRTNFEYNLFPYFKTITLLSTSQSNIYIDYFKVIQERGT